MLPGKKPLTNAVVFEFPDDARITSVKIGPNVELKLYDGDLLLNPESAWNTSSRERTKGGKFLFRASVDPLKLNLNEAGALMQFDRVFCIDTNTKQIGERK